MEAVQYSSLASVPTAAASQAQASLMAARKDTRHAFSDKQPLYSRRVMLLRVCYCNCGPKLGVKVKCPRGPVRYQENKPRIH